MIWWILDNLQCTRYTPSPTYGPRASVRVVVVVGCSGGGGGVGGD